MNFSLRLQVFFFLFLPSLVLAQVTPRNLLQKYSLPSRLQQILISQNSFHPFPRTPDEWKKYLPDTVIQHLISSGENALQEKFPNVPATVTLDFSRNGNRTRYEHITFTKRNRLWNLVIAESMEGKKRFTDALVDGIWSICEESFWGTSAHLFLQKKGKGLPDVEDPVVDLFAAETAANLAMADYFIGPQLDSISPLIRRRIYYEVNRRIFQPMQTAKYEWNGFGNPKTKLNNWAPWIMSNYLTAVLFLEKDGAKRKQYIFKANQITDQYINGIGDDGASEEGPHYWSFGAGCVMDILQLLSSATNDRINIYNQKIIRNMGAYIYRIHISGNYFVNVADSHPEEFPESILVWRYGNAVADKQLVGFGASLYRKVHYSSSINPTFHRVRTLFDLMALKNISEDKTDYKESPTTWLANVQLMTVRLSNGLYIASHGGNNGESHNHNDVGDLIVYANGDPVIIDVGSGTYTAKTFSSDRYKLWYNSSAYHNLPTVNGHQQQEGILHAAHHVSFSKDGEQNILSMNIEKAYPPSAGLTHWNRKIITDSMKIIIVDSFKAKQPVSLLTQSFMTVCNVDIGKPGIIFFTTKHGTKVCLEYGDDWEVSKEIMQLSTEDEQGLKTTWHAQPITRVLLKLRKAVASGSFRYNITTESPATKKEN